MGSLYMAQGIKKVEEEKVRIMQNNKMVQKELKRIKQAKISTITTKKITTARKAKFKVHNLPLSSTIAYGKFV